MIVFHCSNFGSHRTKRSPDLHAQQTTANLASLLLAPINSYQSVLTLLALRRYSPLLTLQRFTTRRSLAHALISSVLKNETVIETPEDVDGILELCHVLIKDQTDAAASAARVSSSERRPGASHLHEKDDLAEEQGWIARMVHLFRAESLDVQFEVRTNFVSLVAMLILLYSFCKLHEDTLRRAEREYVSLTQPLLHRRSNCVGVIKTGNT